MELSFELTIVQSNNDSRLSGSFSSPSDFRGAGREAK